MLYQTIKSRYSYWKYCCCGLYEHQCGILFLTQTSSWIAKKKNYKECSSKMHFWMTKKKKKLQFNTTNNTLPHQRVPAIDGERYCCSELYEHQCGILFFQTQIQFLHDIPLVSFEKKKKIPTYRPKFTWNKQLKCFLTGELRLKCNMWQKCHNHCSFVCQ